MEVAAARGTAHKALAQAGGTDLLMIPLALPPHGSGTSAQVASANQFHTNPALNSQLIFHTICYICHAPKTSCFKHCIGHTVTHLR